MTQLLLTLLLSLPAAAAGDCDKNPADACAKGSGARSPFQQASLNEPLPAALPVKKRAELKPAPEKPAAPKAAEPAPAAAPQAEAAAQEPHGSPASAPMSSPLWLFFVGGSLALLYLYLREGARKRGRK